MATKAKNQILYIGHNDSYLRSISDILYDMPEEVHLDVARNLDDMQANPNLNNYDLFLLDSTFVEMHDHLSLEKVLGFTDRIPVVMVVDPGQENLGKFAMNKGAFDYIVRVEGATSAIPYTIERALQFRPAQKEMSIDFEVESEFEEITSFFELNETGRFLAFDNRLSDILGLSKQELLRSYLLDFIAEEDREKFYQWRANLSDKPAKLKLRSEVIHKQKGIIPVEIELQQFFRPELYFSGFQGYIKTKPKLSPKAIPEIKTELNGLFRELYQLNDYLRQGLLQLFFHKITQLPTQHFHFQFSALYLYSPFKNRYIQELSIGEPLTINHVPPLAHEFDATGLQSVLASDDFVFLVHQSLLSEEEQAKFYDSKNATLITFKEWKPGAEWQLGDRLFLKLKGPERDCQGFILLENPQFDSLPHIHFYRNLEIFTLFVSSLFEAFLRQENLESRLRQLKQVFTVLETFDIEQSIDGLLKEVVWTIKFSLRFNVTAIAVLSNTTRKLHIRAAALEGKEKLDILSRLTFSLQEIRPLLQERFRLVNSYLVSESNTPFHLMKRIVGGFPAGRGDKTLWGADDILLVPIRLKSNRIVGFLLLDKPAHHKRPTAEEVQILEKISKLIAVAIENKLIYTRIRSQLMFSNQPARSLPQSNSQGELNVRRIRRLFQFMNRSNV